MALTREEVVAEIPDYPESEGVGVSDEYTLDELVAMVEDAETIPALSQAAWTITDQKGFHSPPKSLAEALLLVHTEISEAAECLRDGVDVSVMWQEENGKWEGFPVELADAVIRIFDTCVQHDIDLVTAIKVKMAYNATRPYKHGRAF